MIRFSSLSKIIKIIGLGIVVLYATPVMAQSVEELKTKIRFYEDMAATLTSDELSDKALELVKSGTSSDEILDEIKKHPHFAVTVGAHWLKPLAILQGPDLRTFRTTRANGTPTTLIRILPSVGLSYNFRDKNRTLEQRNDDLKKLIASMNDRGAFNLRAGNLNCNGKRTVLYRPDFQGSARRNIVQITNAKDTGKVTDFRDGSIELDISKDDAKKVFDEMVIPYSSCGCSNSVVINSDSMRSQSRSTTAVEIRACKGLVKNSQCGAKLEKCLPNGEYQQEVAEAISLEPAAIIGKTIQDEAKFRDVLLARKGTVNWILKEYLLNEARGAGILRNTPGGYGNVGELKNISKDPKVFSWVNHKNNFGHGVSSTMAFQRATNGRRAKVNKLMQAFMCSDFKVPEGTVFVEDDNEDLTKRAFCSYCHRTLEPMADLYGKWPKLGSTDFSYNKNANSKGQFLGQVADGPRALGRIIADSKQFKGCSVSRGFKFLLGRNMSNKEMRDLAPELISLFESEENLWDVMKSIMKYKAQKYYGLTI